MGIMDEMFEDHLPLLDLPLTDGPDFELDLDLNPKDMMELEELHFDFEEINDLGSWISTSSEEVTEDIGASERLNFEELDIKEAVRYDCMWASYNEFNAHKTNNRSSSSNCNSNSKSISCNEVSSLNLSSSFYDNLLCSLDTPENTNSDCSSVQSEMDTDDDEKNVTDEKKPVNTAHMITSLDHCYISSTHLNNERFLTNAGPLTPPVSDDDDENNQTTFSFSNGNKNENISKQRRCVSSNNKTKSLLKRPVQRQRTSEAKFSFKVKNIKNTEKSRSLLKQQVKIIRAPFNNKTNNSSTEAQLKKKLIQQQHGTSQSAVRRRKERSLKMQEGEAREVHNKMERQRRNELKLAFDDLKDHLPEIAASDKASKQHILDKAVETCMTMKSTESSLKTKVTLLNKTNTMLKEKLQRLRSESNFRSDFQPSSICNNW